MESTSVTDPQDLKQQDKFARQKLNRQIVENAYEKVTAEHLALFNYFEKD